MKSKEKSSGCPGGREVSLPQKEKGRIDDVCMHQLPWCVVWFEECV